MSPLISHWYRGIDPSRCKETKTDGKKNTGTVEDMAKLTLRMMERSCFWARIWAISYNGRKNRREKETERERI